MKISKNLQKKCKQIKLVLSDVDGVMTDGGIYYSKNGEEIKKFNTRDGMGVQLLMEKGIKIIFITKEDSQIVKQRAKKLQITKLYSGIIHKEKLLNEVCKKNNIKPNNVAYIGDDVNDIQIMKKVGLTATPNDGINEIQDFSDYICKRTGGSGAFREFSDLIIRAKNL